MTARGLEGALVDNDEMEVASLGGDDPRRISLRVAGPAALLVAKLHKINDRLSQGAADPSRLTDKDALDVFRLFRGTETADFARRVRCLMKDRRSAAVTNQALAWCPSVFGSTDAPGVAMLRRAVGPIVGPALTAEYTAACVFLANDLVEAVSGRDAG